MRNGNIQNILEEINFQVGSYRTYEEWKLRYPRVPSASEYRVLTVPMRNGNCLGEGTSKKGRRSSYRTYEEWKPCSSAFSPYANSVLTVPMRNGNIMS